MSNTPEPETDAEFWVALALEMQDTTGEEPAIQFIGSDTTDHVFHDAPVDLDDSIEPEPVPTWGECFNW